MAKDYLEDAIEEKGMFDVSFYTNKIREFVSKGHLTLSDLETTETELYELEQEGYRSEIRNWLECARDVYGCSWLVLYMRAVKNVGWFFFTRPSIEHFKWFLSQIFQTKYDSRESYIKSIKEVREFIKKGNFSLDEFGTNEEELTMFES